LDLESITAFNNALIDFKGSVIFATHDHQFISTVANRIIELTPSGMIDKRMPYDEYMLSEAIKQQREEMYVGV
jgi:ATPase subunit of ABC transporter with duplicated ATPase domains